MLRRVVWVLVVLLFSAPVWAEGEKPGLRLVTVAGSGRVSVAPDRAVVRVGVETQDKSLQTAQQQNAAAMARVADRIRGLGVPEQRIRTSTFSVFPIHETRGAPGSQQEALVGYRVTNVVSAQLDDLSLVGRVVDAALAAGANRVEGVDFQLRDDAAARASALRMAAEDARAKARVLAEALGVRLGPVQSISEGGVGIARPFEGGFAAEARAATPILPGELDITAGVSVAYLIE